MLLSEALLSGDGLVDEALLQQCFLSLSAQDIENIQCEAASVKRLGHTAQALLMGALERYESMDLLLEGQQLIEDKQTLGEIDFLLKTPNSLGLQHWELAIKYYLFNPRTSCFHGPSRNDRLDIKLSRMLEHQLPMIQHPVARALWQRWGKNVESSLMLKGRLFYPLENCERDWSSSALAARAEEVAKQMKPLTVAGDSNFSAEGDVSRKAGYRLKPSDQKGYHLNPSHEKGWWMTREQFLSRDVNSGYVLTQKQWLGIHGNMTLLDSGALKREVQAALDQWGKAVMTLLRHENEDLFVFVVPNDWESEHGMTKPLKGLNSRQGRPLNRSRT